MTAASDHLHLPHKQIERFYVRHKIRRLALFGSVLREDFGPESDVDVVVEFEAGHVPGMDFFVLQEELTSIIGRNIDLHTPPSLSRYFRDRVLAEAEVQYEQ